MTSVTAILMSSISSIVNAVIDANPLAARRTMLVSSGSAGSRNSTGPPGRTVGGDVFPMSVMLVRLR